MARLRDTDVGVTIERGEIVLRFAGKPGAQRFSPADALVVSNALGNAAIDALGPNDGVPAVEGVNLRPFDAGGQAYLRLFIAGIGPLTVSINHEWLRALSAAADAALELSDPAARA